MKTNINPMIYKYDFEHIANKLWLKLTWYLSVEVFPFYGK